MDFRTAVNRHSDIGRELSAVAMGQLPGDMIIRNARLVNVLTALIENETDVVIYGGCIAFVGNAAEHPASESTKIIDAGESILSPVL